MAIIKNSDIVKMSDDILKAEYAIEVEGMIEKASVSLKPMYDPLNNKIRI